MKQIFITVLTLTFLFSCKKEKTETTTKAEVKTETKAYVNVKPEIIASPKFINYENYDGSKTSLDDLKGKYVYVDVWATWCPPCRKEIPYLQKVEKKYHNKNIAFVSISLDKEKDKTKWKKMINDKKMGGIQLFAGKDETFTKGYNIRGIPRFILIDPKGNITNANAPRPSNTKAIEQLFAKI
jgi:thiol-disulfide isomerase/thioredoxin